MTPLRARILLIGLLLLLLAGLGLPPRRVRDGTPGRSDADLYKEVVAHTAKRGYYDAMGDEMRARNYPLRSVFNWRLPTLYVGLAHARWLMQGMLWVSIFLLVLGTFDLTAGWHPTLMLFVVGMQVGASVAAATPLGIHFTEMWAGVWAGLAILVYARQRFVAAALLCLIALTVRELVAPFALVAACMALHHRRWPEVTVWSGAALSCSRSTVGIGSQLLGQCGPPMLRRRHRGCSSAVSGSCFQQSPSAAGYSSARGGSHRLRLCCSWPAWCRRPHRTSRPLWWPTARSSSSPDSQSIVAGDGLPRRPGRLHTASACWGFETSGARLVQHAIPMTA